jgi:hypothetical protein
MARRSLFVDFMYAVVAGDVFSKLVDPKLDFTTLKFWGILFLLAVFLEDYFLYETQIAPHLQAGDINLFALIFELLILLVWYLSASCFESQPYHFLGMFLGFFCLKFAAGLSHWTKIHGSVWGGFCDSHNLRNLAFFIPVAVGIVQWLWTKDPQMSAGKLVVLVISWAIMVLIWWGTLPKSATGIPANNGVKVAEG